MNVLNKVILKDLKLNKKRTIVTIIGIILSTALICAVAGMVTSVQKTLIEYSKDKYGNFHVTFCDVPKEELKFIENNRNVDTYYLSEKLGYSKLENSQNEDKPYLNIISADEVYLKNMGLKLIDGRLPENDNEIVISNTIIQNAKVDYKINQKITLDVSKRMGEVDGEKFELNQYNPYLEENNEYLEKIFTKEYTIVGIIERLNFDIEPLSAPGYTVITKLEQITNKANISVLYKNVSKYVEYTEQINEMQEGNKTSFRDLRKAYDTYKYELQFNSSLLRYEGVGLSDSTITTVMTLGIIVIIIIIVSSVFVIRNSFAISMTEKMKEYGMFSSVGATSKQIKKSVLFEGLVIGIIAIPLGILGGIFAIAVLLWLVNTILAEQLDGMTFIYSVPVLPILISVILASVTIYLSAIGSARRAAKISPIDAIRSSEDIKIKSKKIKCPKIINKIFKIGGEISYKNLKRNKKKYRTTIISIVVSVVIFISLSSFMDFTFKMSGAYYKEMNYNMYIYVYSNVTVDKADEICNKISKLDNIKSYANYKENYLKIKNAKYTNLAKEKLYMESDSEYLDIISIGDNAYKEYVNKLGGNIENYSRGGILINTAIVYVNDKMVTGDIYDVKVGEELILIKDNEEEYSIPIVKITDIMPMGREKTHYSSGILVVSDEMIKNIGITKGGSMYINSSNATKLEEDIQNLEKDIKNYINIVNYEKEAKSENAMVLVISIFLYGFITVISLIGITNIFNTITTTMNLRKKEFAMLKSVGMTTKEFNRMIRLETIFYGTKALIIGIPIGTILSYIIYRAFDSSIEMAYMLPIKAIVIAIIFVFVLIGIIMKFSINKINKQNIIETIRNDNI